MSNPDPGRLDPLFGLTARFRSGIERGDTDVVWGDEVLCLVTVAAGQSRAGHSGPAGRLVHFGFLDREGAITKAGRAFLRDNAATILGVVTRALLAKP